MDASDEPRCGAIHTTAEGRNFSCARPPHPNSPRNHYFRRVGGPVPNNHHLEAALEEFFRRQIRLVGGIAIKMIPAVRGIPDRLVIMPGGGMHLVELKADGGQLSAVQEEWHARLARTGATVTVLTGREQIKSWIARTVEAAGPRTRKLGDE